MFFNCLIIRLEYKHSIILSNTCLQNTFPPHTLDSLPSMLLKSNRPIKDLKKEKKLI